MAPLRGWTDVPVGVVMVDTGKAAVWCATRGGVTRLYALQGGAWYEAGAKGWVEAQNPLSGPRALCEKVWRVVQITRGNGSGE